MSLRWKLVLALALLSATATTTLGTWSYVATDDRLHAEIDRSLEAALRDLAGGPPVTRGPRRPEVPGPVPPQGNLPRFDQVLVQVVGPDGEILAQTGAVDLPGVDRAARMAAADANSPPIWSRVDIDGEPYRLVTARLNGELAVQAARSLAETERLLDSLRGRTAAAVLAVTALAAAAGWLVARQVTGRLVRLTTAAEQVAVTGRLDVAVPTDGGDEAGRLGAAFDQMLRALSRSRDAQQRLVQDAGHELRTPLTSLRTNISVLRRHDQLPTDTRERVLGDLDAEAHELTALVNELVDLATEQYDDEPTEIVDLTGLAERAADRTRSRARRAVTVRSDGSRASVRPGAVERAITNLLDNAAKFDSSDAPIEIAIEGGSVTVADRGPGMADADLPRVFDRFYRTIDARSAPGSGLGLAIVRDIAIAHGGDVIARNREGGGAVMGFRLPPADVPT
jgi:two-component system, OmpR family, sensor histidine kinase MprB